MRICVQGIRHHEVRRSTGEAGGVRSVPEVSILLSMSDRHHVRIPCHEYGVHWTYPGAQVGGGSGVEICGTQGQGYRWRPLPDGTPPPHTHKYKTEVT